MINERERRIREVYINGWCGSDSVYLLAIIDNLRAERDKMVEKVKRVKEEASWCWGMSLQSEADRENLQDLIKATEEL